MPYLVMDYFAGTPIDAYCNDHSLYIEALRLFQQASLLFIFPNAFISREHQNRQFWSPKVWKLLYLDSQALTRSWPPKHLTTHPAWPDDACLASLNSQMRAGHAATDVY